MIKLSGIILLSVLISACGNPINRKNAMSYHEWGQEAELAGNYELAERNYSRALINAKVGHSPIGGISMATYNLGRIKGYLCKNSEAEQLLLEALESERKATGPESPIITMRLFELARFYFDYGEHKKSLKFYKEAIPMVKKFNVEESYPLALINVINEYSMALKSTGSSALAAQVSKEAEALKNKHRSAQPNYVPIRYNKGCS